MRHVILLRGINVGGRHRLPMAEVRTALGEAGLERVRTVIQSGNIVTDSPLDGPELAGLVRDTLEDLVDFPVPTITLTGAELSTALASNPFTPEQDKLEHLVVLQAPVDAALQARLLAVPAASEDRGRVAVEGRIVYLDHPDGLTGSARAQKAAQLLPEGTARNLATLCRLMALVED